MQQALKCNRFCVEYRYIGSRGGTPLGQLGEGGGGVQLNLSNPLVMGLTKKKKTSYYHKWRNIEKYERLIIKGNWFKHQEIYCCGE